MTSTEWAGIEHVVNEGVIELYGDPDNPCKAPDPPLWDVPVVGVQAEILAKLDRIIELLWNLR